MELYLEREQVEGAWRNILVVKKVKKKKLEAESTKSYEEKKKIEQEEEGEAKTRTTARMHVKVTTREHSIFSGC